VQSTKFELRLELSTPQDRNTTKRKAEAIRRLTGSSSEEAANLAGKARDVVCKDVDDINDVLARLEPLNAVRKGLLSAGLPAVWSEQGRTVRSGRTVIRRNERGFLVTKNPGEKPVFVRKAAKAVEVVDSCTAVERMVAEVTAAAK
jgi:cob(I)alamin adenosyltransferase